MNELHKLEKEKYQKIWAIKDYSLWSNECNEIWNVINWLKKKPIKKVLVIGCGEGYGIHRLVEAGFEAHGLDIVNVLKFPEYFDNFIEGTIWDSYYGDIEFDACLAIDVLEHIPTEKINDTIKEIKRISKFFYFSIACRKDNFGKLINDELHLTVKPFYWWLSKITNCLNIENYNGGQSNVVIRGRTE